MSLPVVASPLLAALPGVRHAFFTRQGGVSRGLYASLNVGRGSNDDPADVAENRALAAGFFDAAPEQLVTGYQIHSTTVHVVRDGAASQGLEGDAIVTTEPGLVCGALAADCAPILLADADARVVGAAHAGWKGALGGMPAAVVEAMVAQGARRERIVAAVGPCIAQASYEVGLEFLERFVEADPDHGRFFIPGRGADKRHFDLPGFVLHALRAAGVETCEWVERDTCAEENVFFSNRRAFQRGENDYGRLLSAIMLT